MKKIILYSFFLYLLAGYQCSVSAQTGSDSSGLFRGYLRSFLFDTKELILFPKHLLKKDRWYIAGGVVLAGSSLLMDESFELHLRENNWRRDYPGDVIKYVVEPWGNGLYPAVVAAGFYAAGAISDRADLRYSGMFQAKTLLLAMAASRLPKYILQRHRPGPGADAFIFEGPFNGFTGNYSMPSGHSFISFSWAAATASSFEGRKGLKIALYSLATAVSFSRVYKGEHWLSDVTTGALLGYAFGKLSWRIQSLYVESTFRRKKQ